MRFLHPSSRGRTLRSGFCSELLPRCFTTCQFAGSLLCTSHGIETSLLTLLLLRLELGELEAALALESDGEKHGFLKQTELPQSGDGNLGCLDSCLISFIPTANLPCISILGCICFLLATCSPCSRSTCQLQIGTCQEHLPATEQQQGHLPSASEGTEP